MAKSIAQMESELFRAGWMQVDEHNWRAPNGQTYTGVEYCWLIMKGDEWSKQPLIRRGQAA